MAFSIRDWQKASLVRLLTHSSSFTSANSGADDGAGVSSSSSSSAAGGLLDTAWSDDWKVLLYDAYTKAILSPLLTVAELRACGVTLHLPLESPRDAIPDVSAVYLLSPSPSSMRLLAEDAAAGRYRDCSVFVTPSLPRPQLETLAAACVQSGSVPRISRLLDAYSSFVALQPRLFTSVGLHNSFTAFASPAAGEKEVNAFADNVTSSLISLCATVGFTPVIVSSRGGPAEMVARQLESALRDHLASPTAPLFASNANAAGSGGGGGGLGGGMGGSAADEGGSGMGLGRGGDGSYSGGSGAGAGGAAQEALVRSLLHGRRPSSLGVGPGSRPVLILLDRTVDLATPLSHGSSYEALVDDTVGPIDGNRVVLPAASTAGSSPAGSSAVTLAELDEFHPANKHNQQQSSMHAAGAAGSSGGAGAWLLDWASGKVTSAVGGGADGASASSSTAASGGKTLTLDPDGDSFWAGYCRTVIPEAIEAHERELNDVVAREQEIRRKAGAAAASLGAGGAADGLESLMMDNAPSGAGAGGDPSSLSSAIESLPMLLKRKKTLEVHTTLLQAVWQRVAARMLPHLYEQELPLLTHPYGSPLFNAAFSGDAAKAGFYSVIRGTGEKGTRLDRLRLAAIYLLSIPPTALPASAATGSAGGALNASSALSEETDRLLSLLTSDIPGGLASPFGVYAASVLHYLRSLRTSPSLLSASAPHLSTMSMGSSASSMGGGMGGGAAAGMASAAGGLLSSLINKAAAQVSKLVDSSGQQRLPITSITAAICDGKPSMAAPYLVDGFLVLDPKSGLSSSRERTFGSYVAAVSGAYSTGGGSGPGGSAGGATGGTGGGPGSGSSGAGGPLGPASFRNAFVYVVGGCTYSEAADLQGWASASSGSAGAGGASGGAGLTSASGGTGSSSSSARTVVLGGTEVISPSSFLSQLKDLGKSFATTPATNHAVGR